MMSRNLLASAALSFFALGANRVVFAQQPGPPEALILVQPMPSSAAVTISYAGKVPHATAKAALTRLAKRGGWTLSGVEVSDADMVTSGQFGPQERLGVQTGATGIITGAPLTARGGFILQPFADTFRGFRSYKLLYWLPPQSDFQGLRSFDSPQLSAALVQEGGPYRYSIVNHTHDGAAPPLPLTQPRMSAIPIAGSPPVVRSANLWSAVAPIIGIALVAGAVVFFLLRVYARAHSSRRNHAVGSRTTSRDSHRISRI